MKENLQSGILKLEEPVSSPAATFAFCGRAAGAGRSARGHTGLATRAHNQPCGPPLGGGGMFSPWRREWSLILLVWLPHLAGDPMA